MSSGPLPPVPDLIPIALLKSPPGGARRECAPSSVEVMGEQRSRRTGRQPREPIDNAQSRGPSAAPQPPQSRKARSERHRKSDRRREHRKPARTRSRSKHSSPRSPTPPPPAAASPERPPRVNPIFVWVRQEDNRIVDVKCEDYDKRNRILLTKTAQGWRAIPRTETLAPLREAADGRHHHHHRHRKARKSKVRQKSAAVQVDGDIRDPDDDRPPPRTPPPTWTSSSDNDVESFLPSHKIHVPQKCPSPAAVIEQNVNSVVIECAQTQPEKCSAKICDVSPLDNLLAVAEFEFNQHMQSGEWDDKTEEDDDNQDMDDDQKEFIDNINSLIESCSKTETKTEDLTDDEDFEDDTVPKTEECDYNEDDDNNIAMDDILSRLEQSLRSPECPEIVEALNSCTSDYETKIEDIKEVECFPCDLTENENYKPVPDDELENFFKEDKPPEDKPTKPKPEQLAEDIVESSTANDEEEPTDLSLKSTFDENNECNNVTSAEVDQPTDLSVPKSLNSPVRSSTPRPPSQNSEAIQSPQPSGIPAVPPSPDIVSTSANCKNKSVFLESLLSSTSHKIALNSEVTIIKQKEPLDLGKCRKSASPTVTCSEEVKNRKEESEPPTKKFRSQDVTLKHLLDVEIVKAGTDNNNKSTEKAIPETPRLLELLKTDSGSDPLTQLRQLLCDATLNVPDPMLVPKERLSQIISHPGREIPRLLKQRPELRLPEALAFPHLLQDPDILVITLQQLETIIIKQNQSLNLKDIKIPSDKIQEKPAKQPEKTQEVNKESHNNNKKKSSVEDSVNKAMSSGRDGQNKGGFNELANDIDAATTAAFNQMIWLPYLNQLEAMSFGNNNNSEMMKMLSNSLPMYPGQLPELNHLIGATGRFPPPVNFPMQQPPLNYNALEMSMWQEAMMQANMLRPKLPFEGLNPKNSFRDYMDKMNFAASAKAPGLNNHKLPSALMNKPNLPNNFYPSGSNGHAPFQNSYMNMPNSYQANSSKQNLQMAQFNPLFGQKNLVNQQKPPSHSYLSKKFDPKVNFAGLYHQRGEERQKPEHKQKVSCKSFASVSYPKHHPSSSSEQRVRASNGDFPRHHTQPIDLSGSTAPAAKLKVKQHLIDPANASKLLKHHEDVAEVGSTTASVEEMQDAHKHLWHPLFGNQKGYHSPWNWTTVTATGE